MERSFLEGHTFMMSYETYNLLLFYGVDDWRKFSS